jgi:hypothetical protein
MQQHRKMRAQMNFIGFKRIRIGATGDLQAPQLN